MDAGPYVPPPIRGYRPLAEKRVETVNVNKDLEERVLRRIDEIDEMTWQEGDGADPRWLAVAKTHIEQGFMALNRAVMKPKRINLQEDAT